MSRSQGESILIAVAERAERERLAAALRRHGHGVRCAAGAGDALASLAREPAAVVVLEEEPGAGAGRLLPTLRARHPDAVPVVLCPQPRVEGTVALMREGAFHVLEYPATAEELGAVAAKALEHGRLTRGNRDLQSRLDLTERLAMIGRLASGVAHELNNPLDGVRRYVRLTHEGIEKEHQELAQYLERALSGLSRMAGIVRQLLTFSRNVVLENEEEGLRAMLEEVVRTLSPGGYAMPEVVLENPYLDLKAPRALFQVFVNLVKNALDAVEGKGARGRVVVRVARTEDAFEVAVVDNGCGIPRQNLRRVFEPFFTTKDVGKGTGLGLPISARIVERCGGSLRLESQLDSGTTVTVALPLGADARGARSLQGAEA